MESMLRGIAEVGLVYLPQDISIIIGIYTFNKQKIQFKKFLACIVITLVAVSLIRLLPISFGIHTLLSMIVLIFLGVYFLGFPIHKTIMSVFLTFIIILILETSSMKMLTLIYGSNGFQSIMDNPITNAVAGFPVSVLLFVIILILYFKLTKQAIRSGDDGKTGGPVS